MSENMELGTGIEEPAAIDLDDLCQLIGATKDFEAGAHSYLDDIEGQTISRLEFPEDLPEGDREVLELSSDVIRAVFDELAGTFIEPHRETHPALAERGYQLLWAAMRAASNIVKLTENAKVADVFDGRFTSIPDLVLSH